MSGCPVDAEFDPLGESYLRDPFAWMEAAPPVFFAPSIDYYVVTRYADIVHVEAPDRGDHLGRVAGPGGRHVVHRDLDLRVFLPERVDDLGLVLPGAAADAPDQDLVLPALRSGAAGQDAPTTDRKTRRCCPGQESSPIHHLKPPREIPRMKYRWNTKNKITNGRITRTEAAISWLNWMSSDSVCRKLCMPIDSVCTLSSCR